jgi:hypothetical protein
MPIKSYSGIVNFTVSPLRQSGIGIPASASVRYRWSRIIPVVPTYGISQQIRGFQIDYECGTDLAKC